MSIAPFRLFLKTTVEKIHGETFLHLTSEIKGQSVRFNFRQQPKEGKMGDLVGAVISLAFAIVLSVLGLMGLICNIGFKLIKSLNELNKTLLIDKISKQNDKEERTSDANKEEK